MNVHNLSCMMMNYRSKTHSKWQFVINKKEKYFAFIWNLKLIGGNTVETLEPKTYDSSNENIWKFTL